MVAQSISVPSESRTPRSVTAATFVFPRMSTAAPGELLLSVAAEPLGELRQDHVAGMDEEHADLLGRNVRIEAERWWTKVVHAGDRLDAGEAASGDDEGHQVIAIGRAALGLRLLELVDHPVAEGDRVAERLHRDARSSSPGMPKKLVTDPGARTRWS
jgi:hypothetical protein